MKKIAPTSVLTRRNKTNPIPVSSSALVQIGTSCKSCHFCKKKILPSISERKRKIAQPFTPYKLKFKWTKAKTDKLWRFLNKISKTNVGRFRRSTWNRFENREARSAVWSRDHYFLHPRSKVSPHPWGRDFNTQITKNTKTSSDNKRVIVRERCVCEKQ